MTNRKNGKKIESGVRKSTLSSNSNTDTSNDSTSNVKPSEAKTENPASRIAESGTKSVVKTNVNATDVDPPFGREDEEDSAEETVAKNDQHLKAVLGDANSPTVLRNVTREKIEELGSEAVIRLAEKVDANVKREDEGRIPKSSSDLIFKGMIVEELEQMDIDEIVAYSEIYDAKKRATDLNQKITRKPVKAGPDNSASLTRPSLIKANEFNVERLIETDPYLGNNSLEEAYEKSKVTPQVEVLGRLLRRENIYISGPAGSGKSSIVEPFKAIVERFFPENTISIVAPTGVAAQNVGGMTIHSFAQLFREMDNRSVFSTKMPATDILIVDEISMVPAWMLEELDSRMKLAKRNSKKPFGGVQVIFLGDFMQLPPVPDRGRSDEENGFCYGTKVWNDANVTNVYLDRLYRTEDKELKTVLDEVVEGKLSDDSIWKLGSKLDTDYEDDSLPTPVVNGKRYIRMFTINRNIDSYNKAQVARLKTKTVEFKTRVFKATTCNLSDKEFNRRTSGYPEKVDLKVGALIMVSANIYMKTENVNELIPNGSLGTVIGLNEREVLVLLNDGRLRVIPMRVDSIDNDRKKAEKEHAALYASTPVEDRPTVKWRGMAGSVNWMPLRLGYAITVHKSQGQTYDGVVVDLKRLFTNGLGYVALSRVRKLDDLILSGLDLNKVADVDPRSKQISKSVQRLSSEYRLDTPEKRKQLHRFITDSEFRKKNWNKRPSLENDPLGGAALTRSLDAIRFREELDKIMDRKDQLRKEWANMKADMDDLTKRVTESGFTIEEINLGINSDSTGE